MEVSGRLMEVVTPAISLNGAIDTNGADETGSEAHDAAMLTAGRE